MKKEMIIIIIILIVIFIIGGILFGKDKKIDLEEVNLKKEKVLIKSSNTYARYGVSGLMNYKEYGTVICENGNIYEFETQDKKYAQYQGTAKSDVEELNQLFWNGLTKYTKVDTISSGDLEELKEYLKGTIEDYTSQELKNNEDKSLSMTDHAEGTAKELEFYNYDIGKNVTIIYTSDDFIKENNNSNIEAILKIINKNLNTNYKSIK